MTRRSQLFRKVTYELRWDDGTVLLVHKGDSKYSRWYVLDPSGEYLSGGLSSEEAARGEAARIHAAMGNKAD